MTDSFHVRSAVWYWERQLAPLAQATGPIPPQESGPRRVVSGIYRAGSYSSLASIASAVAPGLPAVSPSQIWKSIGSFSSFLLRTSILLVW